MCSVNEDNQNAEMMTPSPQILLKDAVCRRCLIQKSQVILRKVDPYCCDCFMKYAVHKFRSTIGKARAIKHNDNVLLAYSGGLSSGSMVHLVKQGLEGSDSLKMKMIFKPTMFHIDEGCMLNLSKDEKKAITKSILDYAKKCGFDIYICGLEYSLVSDINQLNLQLNCYENSPSDYEIQLQKLLSSVQSLTAKEDLIMRLKQRLITMLAVKLNHPKVFLGPNATRLSSQLLSAVAQGRGAQIAQEIGFVDDRSDVVFLRPMREFVDKEVAYLAHFLQVDSVTIPTISSKLNPKASIGKLTEDFVVNLQANFPSTISTLFRIGDKLKANNETNVERSDDCSNDRTCLLCLSIIEEQSACGAFNARSVSQSISRSGPHGFQDKFVGDCTTTKTDSSCCGTSCNGGENSCCTTSTDSKFVNDLSTVLCYGCKITMEEVKESGMMPINFQEELRSRSRRQLMRQSVEQYLL